jgi:ABC-type transport auxiliary lipoprotein component
VISLRIGVASAALLLFCGPLGCALTSKADPIEVSYLRPDPLEAGAGGVGKPLRLERVESGEALGRGLLVLDEGVLHHDESFQWTEVPAVYLQRALSRTLFEAAPGKVPGFRRDLTPEAPRLVVELLRFEWARGGTLRVECRAVLWEKDQARWERTFTGEARASAPERLGAAASKALADLAAQLRAAVDA